MRGLGFREARADALAADLAAREAELGQQRQVCSDATHGRTPSCKSCTC